MQEEPGEQGNNYVAQRCSRQDKGQVGPGQRRQIRAEEDQEK